MKQTKNVAVICNYSLNPNRIGGMDRFFVAYARACKKEGFQVDWFFSNCIAHSFYEDLNVFASPNISAEEQFLKRSDALRKYDVVVTHFVELCTPFFQRIKKEQKAYTIAVDHNPRPLSGFSSKKRLKNKLYGLIYSKFIDQFISVSHYSKMALIKDFGSKIRNKILVVYNGINFNIYSQKKEYKVPARSFLITSHLRKEKGIQDVITAVNLLEKNTCPNFTIDIYGEGPYEEKLKGMVTNYNLGEFIHFMGSFSNLQEIYSKYDYLIQPSYGETFCFSIVESLASRLPVITSLDVGNVLGLVKDGENGFLYSVKNTEELKIILENLILGKKILPGFLDIENISNEYALEKMVDEHLKLLAQP